MQSKINTDKDKGESTMICDRCKKNTAQFYNTEKINVKETKNALSLEM